MTGFCLVASHLSGSRTRNAASIRGSHVQSRSWAKWFSSSCIERRWSSSSNIDLRWYRLRWLEHEGGSHGGWRRLSPPAIDEPAAETPGACCRAPNHGAHPSAPPAPPDARGGGDGAVPGRLDPQLLRRRLGAGRGAYVLSRGFAVGHRRLGDAGAP